MPAKPSLVARTKQGIASYASNLAAFSANARLYLVNAVIVGAALGVSGSFLISISSALDTMKPWWAISPRQPV